MSAKIVRNNCGCPRYFHRDMGWGANEKGTVHKVLFNNKKSFRGQSPVSGLIHELGHAAHFNMYSKAGADYRSSKFWDKSKDKVSDIGEQFVTDNYETPWVRLMGETVREDYNKPNCGLADTCYGSVQSGWKIFE
ncbi:hypothetical protein [Kangiella sediminilitoris]|uniref:Uncharacterized protein n=1 Tax=Kangiella sediminilitoris TaxID=1144748 RepID=A0A1B3BA08_9GAMM|nr:hypothetical protein [Kangiella sediminilitoris]AOE49637.1 hypothetical protein KS2013_915 [Kangiella sediminilitoris]